MALWGKIDNVTSVGTVSLNYDTKVVTGTLTQFGTAGAAKTGDIIRFGVRDGGGTYFGDAQIVDIASATSCTIGSTMGLTGAALAGVVFEVSELPKSTTLDPAFSEKSGVGPAHDQFVYAITNTTGYASTTDKFRTGSTGWVGVTTYTDCHGNFRVKHECLVAMSGITTGTGSLLYPRTN